jgi:hypothetical protein
MQYVQVTGFREVTINHATSAEESKLSELKVIAQASNLIYRFRSFLVNFTTQVEIRDRRYDRKYHCTLVAIHSM